MLGIVPDTWREILNCVNEKTADKTRSQQLSAAPYFNIALIGEDGAVGDDESKPRPIVTRRLRVCNLRAFTATLTTLTGTAYDPQYLDPADYAAIASGQTGGQFVFIPAITR